jgi:hypothetical protein
MKPSQLFSMNTLLHVLCVFVWWIYLQELSMESHHLNLKQILIFFLSCDAPFSLFLSLSLSHTHTHTHTLMHLLHSSSVNIQIYFAGVLEEETQKNPWYVQKVIEYIIVVAAAGDDCSVGDIIVRDAATTTQECVILFFSPLGNCFLLLLLGCSGRREL